MGRKSGHSLSRAFVLVSAAALAACGGEAPNQRPLDAGASQAAREGGATDAEAPAPSADSAVSEPADGSASDGADAGDTGPTIDDGGAQTPADAGAEEPQPTTALKHPGVLNGAGELAFIRAQVNAGRAPWTAAFEHLRASRYAQDGYRARPFAVVECGSYNSPNVGCTPMVEDGMAVYAQSLLWAVTREQRHADKAIEMIDAWARVYEKNTESNARLVVAWAVPWYVNGAEILRYSGAGWSDEAMARFTAMLQKMLPYVTDEGRPHNNWIQSRIEAHLAIAVWMDDRAAFDAAVERLHFWLPIYLYAAEDGPTPLVPPDTTSAETLRIWRASAPSTAFVDGLSMETCRDLGHLGLGFGSMMYAAEIAFQQGVDVFARHRARLASFMELHGGWMTGARAVPSDVCGGVVKAAQNDAAGISPPGGGGRQVWEIAYSHLHDRLGTTLPFTQRMIESGRPTGGNKWVGKWESLTHAARAFGAAP